MCSSLARFRWFPLVASGVFLHVGAGSARAQEPDAAKLEIGHVLAAQAEAWNAGDVERFMDGYARSPALRFASGAEITYGWRETLERYRQRYPDRAAMGTLAFTDLDVSVLAPDAAVVFGRWRLHKAATAADTSAEPHGLFTLVFRKGDAGWRILADHTSAAAAP